MSVDSLERLHQSMEMMRILYSPAVTYYVGV